MNENYLVLRHLKFQNGSAVTILCRAYEREADAKQFCDQAQMDLQMSAGAAFVVPGPSGESKVIGRGGDLYAKLGLAEIFYEVLPCPIEGTISVAKPQILLAH